MPRGTDDPGFTETDRRAIAEIRRQLDAEFGTLEEPKALSSREPIHRRRPGRTRPHGTVVFLLGALVGGIAGGAAGAFTAVRWLGPDAGLASTPPRSAVEERAAAASPGSTRVSESTALDAALREWLEATRRGDVERQMRYYPARVPVYYTWRDVGRDAVRDEKLKVYGAATRLEIATGTPAVEVTDGGRSALARFRKRYVIEGPVIRRRGEVVQELRWVRMPDGWRIVAERDAEVLSP
jgi:hypothetical protein